MYGKPLIFVAISVLVVILIYGSAATSDVFGQQKKKGYWQKVDCNKMDNPKTEESEFQCCQGMAENKDGSGRYLEIWCTSGILKDGKNYFSYWKRIIPKPSIEQICPPGIFDL